MTAVLRTLSRNMRCGCDCKDKPQGACKDVDPKPPTADCCNVCRDQGEDPPCVYIADFGCRLKYDGHSIAEYSQTGSQFSGVQLRHKNYYDEPCKWVALGETGGCTFGTVPGIGMGFCYEEEFRGGFFLYAFPNPAPEHCCISLCTWGELTWYDGTTITPVVDVFGISWELDVTAAGATLSWDHPVFGLLSYEKATPWVCNNTNTMVLTSHGTLPDAFMPHHICVTPRFDTDAAGGCKGSKCYDDCTDAGYASQEDRCACCDSCQPCAFIVCGSSVVELTRPGVGPDPVSGASGNAFKGGSFTSGPGFVLYCDASVPEWKVDVYCDGVYRGTANDPSFECRNNVMYYSFVFDFDTGGCCSTTPTECCDPEPETLTAEITSACTFIDGAVVTMTRGTAGHWTGTVVMPVIGTVGVELICSAGVWECLIEISFGLSCIFSLTSPTDVECDPFLVSFTGVLDDLAECTCQGATISVTFTE